MSLDSSYNQDPALLGRYYSDSFSVVNTFHKKLDAWPRLASRDPTGLQWFADILASVLESCSSTTALLCRNTNRRTNSYWVSFLVPIWAQLVANQGFPKFETFVTFFKWESNIACNCNSGQQAIRSFAAALKSCMQCGKNPHIADCSIFLSKSPEAQKKFVSDQRLYFGCLNTGHRSKDCCTRRKCKTCIKLHGQQWRGDSPHNHLLRISPHTRWQRSKSIWFQRWVPTRALR